MGIFADESYGFAIVDTLARARHIGEKDIVDSVYFMEFCFNKNTEIINKENVGDYCRGKWARF